jgi:hypothetical protein
MGATSSKAIFANIVNQLITKDVDPADHDVSTAHFFSS